MSGDDNMNLDGVDIDELLESIGADDIVESHNEVAKEIEKYGSGSSESASALELDFEIATDVSDDEVVQLEELPDEEISEPIERLVEKIDEKKVNKEKVATESKKEQVVPEPKKESSIPVDAKGIALSDFIQFKKDMSMKFDSVLEGYINTTTDKLNENYSYIKANNKATIEVITDLYEKNCALVDQINGAVKPITEANVRLEEAVQKSNDNNEEKMLEVVKNSNELMSLIKDEIKKADESEARNNILMSGFDLKKTINHLAIKFGKAQDVQYEKMTAPEVKVESVVTVDSKTSASSEEAPLSKQEKFDQEMKKEMGNIDEGATEKKGLTSKIFSALVSSLIPWK